MTINIKKEEKEFRFWLTEMDNQLEKLLAQLPKEVKEKIDFQVESLLALEKWMLDSFESHQEMNAGQKDRLARYVGEVLRRKINGYWGLETREDHMYYAIPHVYPANACPLRLVTTAVSRKRGDWLHQFIKRKTEVLARDQGVIHMNYNPDHPELHLFLVKRDEELQRLFASMSSETARELDFSPASLFSLEKWLLDRYPDALSTKEDYEWMEAIQLYIGETFIRALGGQWFFCEEEGHPFEGFYILDGFYDKPDPLFPGDLIITCLTRRTGSYLHDILEIRRKRMRSE